MHRLLVFCVLISYSFAKSYVFFSDRDPVIDHLVRWIDQEKGGIDIAIYSFTHARVEEALLRANTRGVRVRAIIDSFSGRMAQRLFEAGLENIATVRSHLKAFRPIFHHKFILFHRNERGRSWVWTGSFNISNAAEKRNFENVLLTDSLPVFQKYSAYFDETFEIIENKAPN